MAKARISQYSQEDLADHIDKSPDGLGASILNLVQELAEKDSVQRHLSLSDRTYKAFKKTLAAVKKEDRPLTKEEMLEVINPALHVYFTGEGMPYHREHHVVKATLVGEPGKLDLQIDVYAGQQVVASTTESLAREPEEGKGKSEGKLIDLRGIRGRLLSSPKPEMTINQNLQLFSVALAKQLAIDSQSGQSAQELLDTFEPVLDRASKGRFYNFVSKSDGTTVLGRVDIQDLIEIPANIGNYFAPKGASPAFRTTEVANVAMLNQKLSRWTTHSANGNNPKDITFTATQEGQNFIVAPSTSSKPFTLTSKEAYAFVNAENRQTALKILSEAYSRSSGIEGNISQVFSQPEVVVRSSPAAASDPGVKAANAENPTIRASRSLASLSTADPAAAAALGDDDDLPPPPSPVDEAADYLRLPLPLPPKFASDGLPMGELPTRRPPAPPIRKESLGARPTTMSMDRLPPPPLPPVGVQPYHSAAAIPPVPTSAAPPVPASAATTRRVPPAVPPKPAAVAPATGVDNAGTVQAVKKNPLGK